jgi:hypothetical protein
MAFDKSPETVPIKCGYSDLSAKIRRRIYRETGIGTIRLLDIKYSMERDGDQEPASDKVTEEGEFIN